MAQSLMEHSQNPFTPAAGKMPPVLVGRESLMRDFEEALDNGSASGRLSEEFLLVAVWVAERAIQKRAAAADAAAL